MKILVYIQSSDDKINPISLESLIAAQQLKREKNADTRISIDSTILVGEYQVHPDREKEYMDRIPDIGNEIYVKCLRSEKDNYEEKKSVFSHYTIESIKRINL